MADRSAIGWTTTTWNPITGCTRVSAGCDNCYAARDAATRLKNRRQYQGLATITKSGRAAFNGQIRLLPERLDQPLRWRKPRKVFVNSMSDLFHEDVPDEFIDRVFAVMALAHRHTFQVLTKRPERMEDYCKSLTWERIIECCNQNVYGGQHGPGCYNLGSIDARSMKARFVAGEKSAYDALRHPPLPNVWLGVSCEDQQRADERIPLLPDTPAALRWVSVEPLLGPIDLSEWLQDGVPTPEQIEGPRGAHYIRHGASRLDWIVVGGESGPGHRPMDPAWVESIRDQCVDAGVPLFVKQDSGPRPGKQGRLSDWLWAYKEFPHVAVPRGV